MQINRAFKFYWRKSSFKKDLASAYILLKEIANTKPKIFLEVGVYQGVTSRNVCELLNKIHFGNFEYIGIDIFEMPNNTQEFTTKHNQISNIFKNFYFNYIKKNPPHSYIEVENLLNKFKKNIKLHKGFSKDILKIIDLNKIDFCFLDGGHSYDTVKEDLNILIKNMKKNSIIVCDDYDQIHYGVKKAVDENLNLVKSIQKLNDRLVKIIV